MLRDGDYPAAWKQFLVFLLPKPGSNKFRPISLASCLLRLCEKLISLRLNWWLETNHILPKAQFGFRKNEYCADNLSILTSEIYTGFTKKQFTSCVSLDIKGAFDNVDPSVLYRIMAKIGISKKIADFIFSLTNHRELFFVIKGELSNPRYINKGTPQGCVLSPTLFNIIG